MADTGDKSQDGVHWSEQVLAYTQGLPGPGIPEDATVCTDSDSSEYEYAAAPDSLTGSPFGPHEDLTPEEYLGRFWNYHKWYSTLAGTRYIAHAPRNPADVLVQFPGSLGQAVEHELVVQNLPDDKNLSSEKHSPVDIAPGPACSDDSPETRGPCILDGHSLGQIIDAGFNLGFSLNLDHFSAPFPSSPAIPLHTPSSPSPPPQFEQPQVEPPHAEKPQPSLQETETVSSSPVNKASLQKRTGAKQASKKKMKKPVSKHPPSNPRAEASSKMPSPTTTSSGSTPSTVLSSASSSSPISTFLPPSDLPAELVWDDNFSKPWTKVVTKKKEAALKKASTKAPSTSQTSKNVTVSPKDKIIITGSGNSPAQPAPSTSSASAQQKGKKKQPAASSPVLIELPPCLSAISPPQSASVCSSSRPAPVSSTSRVAPVSSPPRSDSIVPSHPPAPISPAHPKFDPSPLNLALVSSSPRLAPVSPSRLDPVPSTSPMEPEETSSLSSDGSSSSIEIITERPSIVDTYRGTSEESVERAPVASRAVAIRAPPSAFIVATPTPAAVVSTLAPAVLAPVVNSKPFVIETENWRNKAAEKQFENDETIGAAKQTQDAHEDEKRRVLADAHLKLVEITRQHAHQNPQIAFGNPNALPWPLGMPLMTNDEYREAGRSYPNGVPLMEKTAGYTYWQSESSHPRSAVAYPHMTQHTDQGMHVFTWTRMSEPGYDYLEAFRSDPAKCWFNPPCCQHRHPYAPRTNTPLHWVDGCCCAHDPSRCCPCLTLEMQNAVPEPGLPWGNIPDERIGHDFRGQPVVVSGRFRPVNSGYRTPSSSLAAHSSPEKPEGIGNWPFGPVVLPPANLTGYGYYNPGGSGEWGLINQTGHALSVPFRGYAHGISGQYGPIHTGYNGQYIRNVGPLSYVTRAPGQQGPTFLGPAPVQNGSVQTSSLDANGQQFQSFVGQDQLRHGGNHRSSRTSGSYQHGRPGSGPGPSMMTTPTRPQTGLNTATSSMRDPLKPVGVAEPPVQRRQNTRQVPARAPAFTFPKVTTGLNLTEKVPATPQLSSTETSLPPASNISALATVPVSEPTSVESIDSVFDNRAFAVSVVSNLLPALPTPLDWRRRTLSFSSSLDFIREPSPDPIARPASAPMNLEASKINRMITQTRNWLSLARPEQAKSEHLLMQSLRTDSISLTPDTPHEYFDARQEQNTSPVPSEKSDRPTSPGITTEPVTERTTPQGSPKRNCLQSPKAEMEYPPSSVRFDEGPCDSPWDYPSPEKMQAIRDSCLHKPPGVRFLLTPVTNLSAKPSECKAHKEILLAASPFLAAALQVIKEDEDGITRIHLHSGPRFNCHAAFSLALNSLYDPKRKLSHENIRFHAIKGLGGEPRKKDSDMPFSVHLAKVDLAICYGSAGAFFGYQPAVTRAIELILDLLDWESADFLLCSCLLVGEYMLTVPALHPGAVKPTPAVVHAGQIGDHHMSNFHLNEIGIVKTTLFKFMASNIKPDFELYERAQATYYATRIPHQIWTLPGSYADNMSLEAVRYGGNPSYADLRPKRLDITILSAMLITLPFCFFMNLIDEMKKARAPALTVELMKEVVGVREQRRTWALHILAKKRLLPGVIDQAYLEELAYREFVLFERATDQCVSNAMVHRIWVGLDPPAAPPSRPMTLADLEASFEPNSNGEGSGNRALRNKILPKKGKKDSGPAVPDPITWRSTGKKSTIQTPFAPGSKVESSSVPGSNVPTPRFFDTIAQTPTTPAPDGEQFQTPRKKKNKKNRKKKTNAKPQ